MVLVMDEVDGMSGGDRGGVTDLIDTIKRSKVPIIAICNDKYNQKLKSLRNHCLEAGVQVGWQLEVQRQHDVGHWQCMNMTRLLSTVSSHSFELTAWRWESAGVGR